MNAKTLLDRMVTNDVDIMHVYSGKAGRCCCGCSGKHTYAKAYQKEAGVDRGYPVKDCECNDRMVAKVVRIIRENVEICEVTADYVAVTIGSRLYIAYPLEDPIVR